MPLQLVVIAGPDKGRSFEVKPGETLLVGRSQATPTRLSDQRVSRIHCEIQPGEDGVFIADANSAGGTFVNGKRVSKQRLEPNDVIQAGEPPPRSQAPRVAHQTPLPPPPPPRPALGPAPLTALTGQTLAHYEIGPALAKGQAGTVFQARDTEDGQTVA